MDNKSPSLRDAIFQKKNTKKVLINNQMVTLTFERERTSFTEGSQHEKTAVYDGA
ncbi:hypothetical protein W02_23750 [Nitrospira sp. KM1]|nr:hypothetical protein W02_23750 [Nitrospira sp. KM1]